MRCRTITTKLRSVLFLLATAGCGLSAGCLGTTASGGTGDCCPDTFYVAAVHLNPAFTTLSRKNEDALPDKIEVFVELRDQYGDAMKAAGKFRFEVFQVRQKSLEGNEQVRLGTLLVDLESLEENQYRWDSITRSYNVPLNAPSVLGEKKARLRIQVTFLNGSPYRMVDSLDLDWP